MEDTTKLSDLLLIEQDDLGEDDAFASLTLNPTLRWMKFILTDDMPNDNKMRVPQTEFDNLIKTGVHMPIKMAEGQISQGHADTLPIGVITNLKKVQNRIEGLAALWSKERPEDVEFVVNEFKEGRTPQISWELPHTSKVTDENGITDLQGTCLRAATLVGLPAYAGRTPVLAMASKDTANTSMEETNKMELETLKTQLEEAKSKITELETLIEASNQAKASVETELTELKEFKAQVVAEQEKAEKLAALKVKFSEAGIQRDDEYFVTNCDTLLALEESALSFMVQELAAFSKTPPQTIEAGATEIPNVPNLDTPVDPKNVKTLAQALRARNQKK
jgi:hypothetical protein